MRRTSDRDDGVSDLTAVYRYTGVNISLLLRMITAVYTVGCARVLVSYNNINIHDTVHLPELHIMPHKAK